MPASQNLLMVTPNRIPSERANALQTIKMAEAMAGRGWDVELLAPRRHNTPSMNALETPSAVWDYYGVQTPFSIRYLPAWDSRRLYQRGEQGWFALISLTFAVSLASRLVKQRLTETFVVYTRAERFTGHLLALLNPLLRVPVVFESHRFPPTRRNLAWQRRVDGIVAITHRLREEYVSAGFPPGRVTVAPDGVDLRAFSALPDQETARRELNLPGERPLVIYTGHLFPWKGVYVLAEAARRLPAALFVFVGGMDKDIAALRAFVGDAGMSNVRVVGHVPPARVPVYLAAADVLALPNSAQQDVSRLYTSPLKLFEYMASGRPIVASDLPSLREILDDEGNACLVPADDPQALAQGIRSVLCRPVWARRLAEQARQDVEAYSWEQRAEKVTRFIRTLCSERS